MKANAILPGVLALAFAAPAAGAGAPAPPPPFVVTLPAQKRPLPEPLPAGAKPGFAWRGLKGWAWTPEQYLAEIPYLVRFRMNFLMNCYLTMFDYEHHATGSASHMAGESNRWWEDVPARKKAAMEQVVAACRRSGIEFCFSMNPNYLSRRLLSEDAASIDLLWKHYAWMQRLGVRWFNLSVDDAKHGINASTQSLVVNEILRRLRTADPGAQFIFTPTIYNGNGTGTHRTGTDVKSYLEALAREMHPEIYFFWTGNGGFRPTTRDAAEGFRRTAGHRLFYWDNYPVNDGRPTLHLGPVIGRPMDLGDVVDGYVSNPHHTQNEINRIPLATCADYAYNPRGYDPARAIGQAILSLAESRPQQLVLKELVETYPGMLIHGKNTAKYSPVREQLGRILRGPEPQPAARAYVASLRELAARFKAAFPHQYAPEKATLDREIALLADVVEGRVQLDLFSRPEIAL